MAVNLIALETVVPATIMKQPEIRDAFMAQPGLTRLGQRLVGSAFNASGIETRYSVIRELDLGGDHADWQFYDPETGLLLVPGTRARNEVYIAEATPLFVSAAEQALAAAEGIERSDVTHVITVSCTGFYAPGPDYQVVRALGLGLDTQRYHLGFMGCYATFPALRAAKTFCEADPDAVVLVVSAELCSLHVRSSNDPDTIVASSLFADGAGAAVVTGRDPAPGSSTLRLDHFETILTAEGEADMAWKIGDEGFEMVLSSYVPKIIEANIGAALTPLLARDADLRQSLATVGPGSGSEDTGGIAYREIEHWAIHPGGRSILDRVETALDLGAEQLVPSRETLRQYGNMSSATIMFVLQHIMAAPAAGAERVCAMAFGPGLTVETALFTKLPGMDRQAGGGF